MVGMAMRRYARKHKLNCDGGYVYGKINGRYVILDEGYGFKRLRIYLYPPAPDPEAESKVAQRVLDVLEDCDRKALMLKGKGAIAVQRGFAVLTFGDVTGSMKYVDRYIHKVMPGLDAVVSGGDRCACCGAVLEKDVRFVELDGVVQPVHAACATGLAGRVEDEEQAKGPGSILAGILGALLGAVLGAIPWALTFMAGYIAVVFGIVISLLADFFYGKFHGRRGAVRLIIVALAVVLGISLGQAGGYTLLFAKNYDAIGGKAAEISRAGYVRFSWEEFLLYDQNTVLGIEYDRQIANLSEDELEDCMTREEFIETYYSLDIENYRLDMRAEFRKNYLLGLFMGLLGFLGSIRRLQNKNRRRRVRELN